MTNCVSGSQRRTTPRRAERARPRVVRATRKHRTVLNVPPVNRALVLICALVAATVVACNSSSDHSARSVAARQRHAVDVGTRTRVTSTDGALTLETLSARARFVSGGAVLVDVSGSAASGARLTRNGSDVSASLAHGRALVRGLHDGRNTIVATAKNSRVELTVVNHPKNGPMLARPQIEPWVCTTQQAGLGKATNDDCDAPAKTSWSYRTTGGAVKPLADSSARPADIATTTVGGKRVPFVIRTETGVIDRGVYWIWTLDPSAGHP